MGTDPTVLPFLMFGTGAEVFKKTAAELMGGEKAKQSIHRTSPRWGEKAPVGTCCLQQEFSYSHR